MAPRRREPRARAPVRARRAGPARRAFGAGLALMAAGLWLAACDGDARSHAPAASDFPLDALHWAGEGEPGLAREALSTCEAELARRALVEAADRPGARAWIAGCMQAAGWRLGDPDEPTPPGVVAEERPR